MVRLGRILGEAVSRKFLVRGGCHRSGGYRARRRTAMAGSG